MAQREKWKHRIDALLAPCPISMTQRASPLLHRASTGTFCFLCDLRRGRSQYRESEIYSVFCRILQDGCCQHVRRRRSRVGQKRRDNALVSTAWLFVSPDASDAVSYFSEKGGTCIWRCVCRMARVAPVAGTSFSLHKVAFCHNVATSQLMHAADPIHGMASTISVHGSSLARKPGVWKPLGGLLTDVALQYPPECRCQVGSQHAQTTITVPACS